LKPTFDNEDEVSDIAFNRTFVELKHNYGMDRLKGFDTFNRTFVELKLKVQGESSMESFTFNRTFVELKQTDVNFKFRLKPYF